MRLFVGLPLPPEYRAMLVGLDPKLRGLRWLPAEQLHLTMSFLGEVAEEPAAELRAQLAGVRVPPFFLPLQGVGSFQSRGKVSVVWVGVGRGHPHLFALHKKVQDAVLRAGLEPDLRPFHPHVTVGRARELSRPALQPFLKQHHDEEFGLFKVEGFTLFSSVLSPEGSTYHVELEVEFDG
jgi:2'-5' RNA ligase